MVQPPHIPVLFKEALELMKIRPGRVYLDATCGAAGHAAGICERIDESGRLIAVDRDESAIAVAEKRLAPYKGRVTFHHGNFAGIDRMLDELKIESTDGALADLGLSSMQLDDPKRGFSFESHLEVDMRMDQSRGWTAANLIRNSTTEDLARIISAYGEQPFARRIARAIAEAAAAGEELTGRNLRRIVHLAIPPKNRRQSRIDPATRVFQALRIEVNGELAALESFLERVLKRMSPGARLVVISFHSLEDRIVKRFFREQARGCICPPKLPECRCGRKPEMKIITRKPIVAGEKEKEENPRARSAKLRAAEKLE